MATLKSRQVGSIAILTPRGYLTGGEETEELERGIKALGEEGNKHLVINLSETQHLNSTALGALTVGAAGSLYSAALALSAEADTGAVASVGASAGSTATDQMARLEGSKRRTRGSFTSVRSVGRRMATFSRTSSAALRPLMCN